MEKNLQGFFSIFKDDVLKYIDLRLKLFRIEAYEKIGKVSAVSLLVLIFVFMIFFAVLFLFLGLGLYLGQLFGSLSLGMVAVGFLYLLLSVVLFLCRKYIMNKVFELFVSELMKEENGDKKE